MLTAQQVQNVTFSTVRLGLGYNMVEVDDLLDRLGDTLRDYEQGGSRRDVTAEELSGATFNETKLREGYKPGEIDEFLRQAIETLQAYEATVGAQGMPPAGAADPGAANGAPGQPAPPAQPNAPAPPGVHAQPAPAAPPGVSAQSAAPVPPTGAAQPAAPGPPAAPGQLAAPGQPGVPAQPAEQPSAVPPDPSADPAARPMRRPSGYAAPSEEGLGVSEVVHRLQSLQAAQDGGLVNAPLQVRTPDGRTYTIAAVKSSPSGLVITLAN